jgi:outer membrane protein
MTAKKALVLFAVFVIAGASAADAQSWVLRARGISIDPDASSSTIGDTGTSVDVDSATTLEVDLTRKFNKFFGLELIAATAKHDIDAVGGALAGASAGSVKVLPPTLTFQWFILGEGMFSPYIGAGINYTYFYDYSLSDDLAGAGVTDIDFDDSMGFAGNIGLDINLGNLIINGDIKYIQIDTDATRMTATGPLATISVDVNPWVFGVGVGYRF